jgi:hypothetical protein
MHLAAGGPHRNRQETIRMNGKLARPGVLGAALLLGCLLTSPAYGIAVGQTSEFSGGWSGTDWSLGTAGVYNWRNSSAVGVDPYHMLTAAHVGGQVGDMISIRGTVYTVTGVSIPTADAGQSTAPDLCLLTFDKALPAYETLYTGALTRNQDVIMVGYGDAGADNGNSYTWTAGTAGVERWGTNSIANPSFRKTYSSGTNNFSSSTFTMTFRSGDTEFEAGYADRDSGGGTFVKVGDEWELAGINGYVDTIGGGRYTTDYAISIPYYSNWITNSCRDPVAMAPEPASLLVLTAGAACLLRRRTRR